MKLKQAQLVDSDSVKDLEIQVSNMIAQGWQPFGSFSVVAPVDKGPRYFQAMVLPEIGE